MLLKIFVSLTLLLVHANGRIESLRAVAKVLKGANRQQIFAEDHYCFGSTMVRRRERKKNWRKSLLLPVLNGGSRVAQCALR